MRKEYINDLFTEGLGDIFYMKMYNYLNQNIKSLKLLNILLIIHKFFYIIFLILVAIGIFLLSYPL